MYPLFVRIRVEGVGFCARRKTAAVLSAWTMKPVCLKLGPWV
jgi:hypothetical protein